MNTNDLIAVFALLVFVCLITLLGYRVQGFNYHVEGGELLLRSSILGLIPINMRIPLDSIISFRKVPLPALFNIRNWKPWPILWGMPRPAMILIVRRSGLFRGVFVSPRKPDELVTLLEKVTGNR